MTKEEYFFKDILPIKEQAYIKYHVAPWLNGETKEEFIRKSDSLTDEELERFDLDYKNCHNRCIYNPLYQIFVHHNDSWDEGNILLLSEQLIHLNRAPMNLKITKVIMMIIKRRKSQKV